MSHRRPQFLDGRVVGWAARTEDLQQLLEVALVVRRGRPGRTSSPGSRWGWRRRGTARGHDDDRALGCPYHPAARTRLPLLPVVGGPDPGLEGEHVQLAFEHVEQLLAARVHVGAHVEPGRYQYLEVDAVRECEPVTLSRSCVGGGLHDPAVTRWYEESFGHGHRVALHVTGRASGPRNSTRLSRTGPDVGERRAELQWFTSASTRSSDSSLASIPPGQRCGPKPNATCGLGLRSKSMCSGSGKTSGSRLAARYET